MAEGGGWGRMTVQQLCERDAVTADAGHAHPRQYPPLGCGQDGDAVHELLRHGAHMESASPE
jgi:hypothetical protein